MRVDGWFRVQGLGLRVLNLFDPEVAVDGEVERQVQQMRLWVVGRVRDPLW